MSEWASPDPGSAASPSASPTPAPPSPPVAPPPGTTGSVPAWAQETRRGVVPLRPLTVGEVLDGSITTIRRNPRPMLTIGVIAAVLLGLTQLAAYALNSAGVVWHITSTDSDGTEKVTRFPLLAELIVYFVTTVLTIALSAMAAGVLRQALIGKPASTKDLRLVPWGRLVGVSLLVGVVVMGLSVTFIGIPFAIFFYTAWAFVGPVLALEGASTGAALKRSRDLVRTVWWRTFGILLLAKLIGAVIQFIILLPAGLLIGASSFFGANAGSLSTGDQLVLSVATAVGVLLTWPFTVSVHALLYTDRRMRVEGLDVALQQAAAAHAGV